MAAATSNDRAVEEVFEEGEAPKQAQTIHRIRANSTIMQLSKILGESIAIRHGRLLTWTWGDMSESKVRHVEALSDMWTHCIMQ